MAEEARHVGTAPCSEASPRDGSGENRNDAHRSLVLATDRLILRPPISADFEPWARQLSDEETMRYVGGPVAPEIAWRLMRMMAGCWFVDGYGFFSVIERATGNWVGRVGPWQPPGWPGPEVGWTIVRERWGAGYATEAAEAVIGWVFERLGWQEVIHTIHPDNFRSQSVARRLGAIRVGRCSLPPPKEAFDAELWRQSRGATRPVRKRDAE